MVQEKVIIRNLKGIHLKPAGVLCNEALKYNSSISLINKNKTVNAKSILGILGACVKNGDEVEIICNGSDEELALKELTVLIKTGLGEKME